MNASPAQPASTEAPGVRIAPEFYTPGRFKPEQSVGYLMRRVLGSILGQVDARLGEHDLTYAQWLPLYKLTLKEGEPMAVLSRELGMDPGALTRSLDRLEAKGLVRRERSATDRRVVNLHLTDAGRSVAAQVPPVLAEVLNLHLVGFTEAEWQTLLSLLQRMMANAEALRSGEPGALPCPPIDRPDAPPAGPCSTAVEGDAA